MLRSTVKPIFTMYILPRFIIHCIKHFYCNIRLGSAANCNSLSIFFFIIKLKFCPINHHCHRILIKCLANYIWYIRGETPCGHDAECLMFKCPLQISCVKKTYFENIIYLTHFIIQFIKRIYWIYSNAKCVLCCSY